MELVYRPGGDDGGRKRPTLRLSLDLVELLGRMADGYAPTTAESRGPLVNLLVFRTLLAHEPYEQLLLVDLLQQRRFRVEQHGSQITLAADSDTSTDATTRSNGPPTPERRPNAAR
jgi:hypothetical protein